MKQSAKLLFIITFIISKGIFSQVKLSNFSSIIYRLEGDLNKDNLKDIVLVKEDKHDKKNPFLLEIKFKKENGIYETILTSTKAVMEKFPYEDVRTEITLENFEIKNGMLIFRNQMLRGGFIHKFRFQNGNFELIGFTLNNASPGYIEFVDYNLSTGLKITKHREYETDKIILYKETNEKISPLPKLQDFTPFDFVY